MQRGRGSSGASALGIDLMTKVVAWSMTGLRLSVLAFVISTGYVLYGVYGGHLSQGVEPRILDNLRIMGQIMAASGALGAICLVIVTYEEVAYTAVAGILGLGYMFGFPLMVAGQVQSQAQQAGETILKWSNATGEVMLVIVGLRMLHEIVNFIKEAPRRRERLAEEQGLEKPKYVSRGPIWRLSRCWEMPYCHEAIKEMCPAYQARKNCWRIGRGCNCDPYLIESLLRRGAGKEISQQDEVYMRSDLAGGRQAGGERTRECRDCPIFNEHQREKFRVLNPVFIAATILGLVAAYPVMRGLYAAFIASTARVAEKFAFGTQVPVGQWIQRLDSPAVWVFFCIIVGLLALSYVLKAIEWAILVRKIV